MSDLISRKGVFIPDITVEMFRNASLESIEDLMASGEMEDILLPSAQPEQQWIPCSDDNPKADGRYLITGKMGTVYSLDFEDGRWYGGIKPVAWMPLPEPYKGGEQDG